MLTPLINQGFRRSAMLRVVLLVPYAEIMEKSSAHLQRNIA